MRKFPPPYMRPEVIVEEIERQIRIQINTNIDRMPPKGREYMIKLKPWREQQIQTLKSLME